MSLVINGENVLLVAKMYQLLEDAMCLLAENDKECKALAKEIRALRLNVRRDLPKDVYE